MRLDERQSFPSGMEEYLSHYGWHFSKHMCEWASSKMYKSDGRIKPYTKESLKETFQAQGFSRPITYDMVYLANMCKADYLGSAIPDDVHLIKFVTDTIDDPDGYDGMPFTRFYADCIGSGTSIDWEDML